MKTLRDAKIGDTVKVVKLHGEGAVKRRIMDMGLTKGTEVFIRKVAPLGDPVMQPQAHPAKQHCHHDRDGDLDGRSQPPLRRRVFRVCILNRHLLASFP